MQTQVFCSPRKTFSRIGWILCALLLITVLGQVLFLLPIELLFGDSGDSSWGMWLSTFVPIYLVAAPIAVALFQRLPAFAAVEEPLGAERFFTCLLICAPLMYGGSLLGTLLSALFSSGSAENSLLDFVFDSNPIKLLVIVVAAPLVEEFLFRKEIIDHARPFGEKAAVLLSALAFGLFHGNLYQFFYAFGIGLVFGYVYLRTGRLRYSVLLHMTVNFFGSVVAPVVLTLANSDAFTRLAAAGENATPEIVLPALPALFAVLGYSFLLISCCITGLVLLIVRRRSVVFFPASLQPPAGQELRAALLNPGMLVYTLLCAIMMVLSLL